MTKPPEHVTKALIDKIAKAKDIHIVVVGTKPDIIKQAPIYHELLERGETVILCHTGQHYDFRYSGGALEEFGLNVDIRLTIEGTLSEKTAQIIERFGAVLDFMLEQGKIPIPYVHGDTSTAAATAYASMLHRVACVHVEAGIRTLTPRKAVYHHFFRKLKAGTFDWFDFYYAMQDIDNFSLGSIEPFPEQFNTRMIEPASGFYAAPVELDRKFLLSEGFEESKIEVVGNTISDVTLNAMELAKKSDVFTRFPKLKDGNFIMVSIHRRENIFDEARFTAIIDAMEKLVTNKYKVLLLSLLGTEDALDRYGFRKRIENMIKKYPDHFIYSLAWPFHHDVIAAMQRCAVVVSDSGGLQEEANIVGAPSVTLRFGSDRPETILAGANVPAPPIDSEFMYEIIKGAFNNEEMRNVGSLYGKGVANKIVNAVQLRMGHENGFYMSEEQRLGF